MITFSKIVMGEIFLMARIFLPKKWRGGAKFKWRNAAVALMQWHNNFCLKNGAVVRWHKDLKCGARPGGAD